MKKLFISSLLAIAPILLIGCESPKKVEQPKKIEKEKKTKQPQITKPEGTKVVRTKTNSGLEYEIIKEGTGASPEKGKPVTVHYTGWLDKNGEPGAKFDSSVDRGQPFTFIIGVGQVIKGWDEGVASMKVGEKRRLFIPSTLGYGTRGAGAVIPPNANLIFDVELLNVG
jgi:FKBP-type peptidyl-prolyl cis-trans isomerase FkpA